MDVNNKEVEFVKNLFAPYFKLVNATDVQKFGVYSAGQLESLLNRHFENRMVGSIIVEDGKHPNTYLVKIHPQSHQ